MVLLIAASKNMVWESELGKRSEKVSTLFQKISIFSAANNTFWSMSWCIFSELNGWNFTHQSRLSHFEDVILTPDRHPKFACQILDIFPDKSGKPTETVKRKNFSQNSRFHSSKWNACLTGIVDRRNPLRTTCYVQVCMKPYEKA